MLDCWFSGGLGCKPRCFEPTSFKPSILMLGPTAISKVQSTSGDVGPTAPCVGSCGRVALKARSLDVAGLETLHAREARESPKLEGV